MVFEEKDKPRCIPGFVVVIVTSAVAGLLVMVYRYVCIWDNRKRDKAGTVEGFENAYQDDFTDKTVSIRTPVVNWFSFLANSFRDRIFNSGISCKITALCGCGGVSHRDVRSVGGSVGLSAPDGSRRFNIACVV